MAIGPVPCAVRERVGRDARLGHSHPQRGPQVYEGLQVSRVPGSYLVPPDTPGASESTLDRHHVQVPAVRSVSRLAFIQHDH